MLQRVAVIVMAKHPTPGKVKTRLLPELSAEQAAAVHRVFLLHVLTRLRAMNPAELVICFDPPDRETRMRELCGDATYLEQVRGDLGERLAAAHREIGKRHERLLFLGVDSPDVPVRHLILAAEYTERVAVSISPTEDGGFWSLGLWKSVDAEALLGNIAWSSGQEARQTLQHAESLGHAGEAGARWDDIDHFADLQRLMQRLGPSSLLRELQQILRPG